MAIVQGLVDNDQEDEEEFEVDIQEDEAAFLKGISSRSGVEMSPIKIVKNPDGSLQRAAMTQSALAKERRELREQQQRTLVEAIPKDLSRPWEDPLPEKGERHLAQELRGIGLGGFEVPEWKKQAEGKVCTHPSLLNLTHHLNGTLSGSLKVFGMHMLVAISRSITHNEQTLAQSCWLGTELCVPVVFICCHIQ